MCNFLVGQNPATCSLATLARAEERLRNGLVFASKKRFLVCLHDLEVCDSAALNGLWGASGAAGVPFSSCLDAKKARGESFLLFFEDAL